MGVFTRAILFKQNPAGNNVQRDNDLDEDQDVYTSS